MDQIPIFIKWLVRTVIILICSAVIGFLLLLAAFRLKTGLIFGHLLGSVLTFENEGDGYDLGGIDAYIMDSYDDAIFLGQTLVGGEEGVIDNAMHCYEYTMGKESSQSGQLIEVLKAGYGAEAFGKQSPLIRFWCGYLVPLKLLLKFLTFSEMRLLNLLFQPVLMYLLLYLMHKKGLGGYAICIFIAWLLLGPVSLGLSLTFSGFYYCTVIPCILLTMLYDRLREKWMTVFFLLTGISVIYFCINFFQLISFAFPFVILCLLDEQDERYKTASMIDGIKKAFIFFTNWAVGFFGMMCLKWILYSVFADGSIFKEIYENILMRAGSTDKAGNAISRFDAVAENFRTVFSIRAWLILEIVFILWVIVYGLIKKKTAGPKKLISAFVMTFITLSLLIVWYALFANHVYIHAFIMYRLMSIPFLILDSCLVYCFCQKGELPRRQRPEGT